jgi:hypothetical protein
MSSAYAAMFGAATRDLVRQRGHAIVRSKLHASRKLARSLDPLSGDSDSWTALAGFRTEPGRGNAARPDLRPAGS